MPPADDAYLLSILPEMTAIRHRLHQHPEIGMEEHWTANEVASLLRTWNIETHEGIGGTGVVGVIRNGNGPSIGLRAELDALPITEDTGVPHASLNPGLMHACGHDGHTATLLTAARMLNQSRRFHGTVVFIFQPGEEGHGGAEAMIAAGLFRSFPCDAIYALHNIPGLRAGRCHIHKASAMSGAAQVAITLNGHGSHASRPQDSRDPLLAACQIVSALQAVPSHDISALEPTVLSITTIHAGTAFNVIPQQASIGGTVRAMSKSVMETVEDRIRTITNSIATMHRVSAAVDFKIGFIPLKNDLARAKVLADAAVAIVGEENVDRDPLPRTAADDFAFMLEHVPGAMLFIGSGEQWCNLHNPGFDYNDTIIPIGAKVLVSVVEQELGT